MKKTIVVAIATAIAMMSTITATACPQWECQLALDDYSCGGIHTCSYTNYTNYINYTTYNETSVRQPIYCQYCGHESWDCVCDSYSSSDSSCYDDYNSDCDYNYADENYDDYDSSSSYDSCSSYSSCSSYGSYAEMTHWANIRDCYGNIIGQAGCGDAVSIIGEESDTGRVIIYHYNSGVQGSVLAECVYGGYQWDGTGDNGDYNSYQGDNYESWDSCDSENGSYGSYVDCGYSDSDYSTGSCGGSYQSCPIGSGYYVSYTEMINIFRQYVAGGYGYGFGGCR